MTGGGPAECRSGDRRAGMAGRLVRLAAGLSLALLAACTTTTTVTTTASGLPTLTPEPYKAGPVSNDPVEIDRRAKARLDLASAYFARGQLDTALEEVKLAIAARPDQAGGYSLQALIYAAMNEDGRAEDSFARALQLSPNDSAILHNKAWYLCQRGRFAESQLLFSQALANPNYREVARSQLARGVCYGRDRQWRDAEVALMRAYELEPSNPSAGINLAEVLYERGEYERARFYIGRVNDVPESVNSQTLWLAIRIERKLGQESSVRVLGQRLRQSYPQSPEAALYERGRFDG